MYEKVLQKNLGWFDDKDNASGILTAAMAEDTYLINGVGADSISPQMEANFSILCGVVFGFVYCWEEALICLAVTPFMIISKVVHLKIQTGISTKQGDLNKEANLYCSDCICNFKTVQSFGYQDIMVEQYNKLLIPAFTLTRSQHCKTGVAFGLSQMTTFFVMGAMLYGGGWVIENSIDPETGIPTKNPSDVFLAIFAMMFGASHAGTA